MKDNIYIKALEIGLRNETNDITFNEVVKQIGIGKSIKDEIFKTSFIIWFYTNFYNPDGESSLKYENGSSQYITPDRLHELEEFEDKKSFIKGDAIQKYIDYLELKESRESSQIAKKISYFSIGIAIASIFLSPFLSRITPESPKQVIVIENRDKANDAAILERLTKIDSTINKLSLIAEKKVEVLVKKQAKVKSVKH